MKNKEMKKSMELEDDGLNAVSDGALETGVCASCGKGIHKSGLPANGLCPHCGQEKGISLLKNIFMLL